MPRNIKELRKALEPLGAIQFEYTSKGHLKLTHVASGAVKHFSKTPSDRRAQLNMISQFRALIRERQASRG